MNPSPIVNELENVRWVANSEREGGEGRAATRGDTMFYAADWDRVGQVQSQTPDNQSPLFCGRGYSYSGHHQYLQLSCGVLYKLVQHKKTGRSKTVKLGILDSQKVER
jgi:hypothetical protein